MRILKSSSSHYDISIHDHLVKQGGLPLGRARGRVLMQTERSLHAACCAASSPYDVPEVSDLWIRDFKVKCLTGWLTHQNRKGA